MVDISRRKSKHSVLGLDLGSHTIKAMEMIRNGSLLSIRNCSLVEVNPRDYAASIAAVVGVGGYRPDSVVIGVSGRGVLLQSVSISADRAEDMLEAVKEGIAGALAYAIEDAVVDYSLDVHSHGRNISVLAVAARRSEVLGRVNAARSGGVEADRLEVELVSLANAVETVCAGDRGLAPGTPVCIVDFGASKTLIVVTDGVNRLFHEFPFGGSKLTEMVAHRFGCGVEEAEARKLEPGGEVETVADAVYPGVEDMAGEIRGCLGRFRRRSGREVERVYLSGGLLGFGGVEGMMGRMLGRGVVRFDPFAAFGAGNFDAGFIRAHGHRMGVAFGMSCHAGD